MTFLVVKTNSVPFFYLMKKTLLILAVLPLAAYLTYQAFHTPPQPMALTSVNLKAAPVKATTAHEAEGAPMQQQQYPLQQQQHVQQHVHQQ